MMLERGDLAVWPHTDLECARITRANVLLVGVERPLADVVSVLVADLHEWVTIRPEWGRLQLPPLSSHIEKVVLRDVDTLTPEGQRSLLEWLDLAKGCTQVISIASAPLLRRVETGGFDAALYYRLNMIYIDLSK
jgi:hypothetical protein